MIDSNILNISTIYYTSKRGQRLPFSLNYSFNKILDITEEQIPFIKPVVFVKDAPDINIEGVNQLQIYDYGANYYQFYGDANLIYKGYNAGGYTFTEVERLAGQFNTNFASKWYWGKLTYYVSSPPNYEMRSSYIVKATTYYDVVPLFGHPGYYSYKKFEAIAIDSISSSSITGTGTYTVVTATEVEGNPVVTTVVTKNSNQTAPMFEDTVSLQVSGLRYFNNRYQGNHTIINPLTVTFTGTINGGNATLVDFDYDWETQKVWRLFFDSNRASWFLFNVSTNLFLSLPVNTNYQSGNLPYTKIYVDLNPEGYPEIELDSSIIYTPGYDSSVWTKINDNKYCFRMSGTIVLSSPALKETSTTVDFVDESYSQSGGTYVRDAINRDDKIMPLYLPQEQQIEAKLILSYNNPLNFHRERHRKINE